MPEGGRRVTAHAKWSRAKGEAIEPIKRFLPKVDASDYLGCWPWRGSIGTRGYGMFRLHSRGPVVRAHRFAYEALVGPIPAGMTLDHLCRNRACVNPAHLEPVSNRENILRGTNPAAQNARRTHCRMGHEFSAENTHITPQGDRRCRACQRERDVRRWHLERVR